VRRMMETMAKGGVNSNGALATESSAIRVQVG
jgi:hypothetical protein